MGVKKPKIITPIEDGVNRRFFQAIEALVSLGRLSALGIILQGSRVKCVALSGNPICLRRNPKAR